MKFPLVLSSALLLAAAASAVARDDTVSVAVFSRTGNGYKRQYLPNGTPKPEFYALANGGAAGGTTRDETVDKLTFPDVTKIAMPLLYHQGYRYAMDPQQATLLIVVHWGNTIPYNDANYRANLAALSRANTALQSAQSSATSAVDTALASDQLENLLMIQNMEEMDRNLRDRGNARLLGFIDDINDNNDMRRYVGGQRYNELRADIGEPRYYLIVSAYDFRELTEHGRQKLLWVTRVSVATQGNSFDRSLGAMVRNAARHFGRNTDRLLRGEELRGVVEMHDLEFIDSSAAEPTPAAPPAGKK